MFRSGPGEIACDLSGSVTSVRHDKRPGLSYLAGGTVTIFRANGRALDVIEAESRLDVDELELVSTYAGLLRITVRHTFAAGWGLRVAFTNLSAAPLDIDEAVLLLSPGEACVGWAVANGVTGGYAVLPADGAGPVLGGLLRLGSIAKATASGLQLSPIQLPTDGRYVLQLQWGWYSTPKRFSRGQYPELPQSLWADVGEPVQLEVDDDVAVVSPDGVGTTTTNHRLEVVSDVPGTFPFELRSARGTTTFDLSWVQPVGTLLTGLARGTLQGLRTGAGVVRLSGLAEALVVQHALAAGTVDEPDDAKEALDLFTVRLEGSERLDPLEAAYLCREFDRTGDADLLDRACTVVLGAAGPLPGLGIAATHLCLALIVSGQPVDDVLASLGRQIAHMQEPTAPGATGPVLWQEAAALELAAVTSAAAGVRARPPGLDALTQRAAALGVHLGAGLKGSAVTRAPLSRTSHLLTVLQLLPDWVSAELETVWGCSANVLAARATPELLARLEDEPVGPAHAWLCFAVGDRG